MWSANREPSISRARNPSTCGSCTSLAVASSAPRWSAGRAWPSASTWSPPPSTAPSTSTTSKHSTCPTPRPTRRSTNRCWWEPRRPATATGGRPIHPTWATNRCRPFPSVMPIPERRCNTVTASVSVLALRGRKGVEAGAEHGQRALPAELRGQSGAVGQCPGQELDHDLDGRRNARSVAPHLGPQRRPGCRLEFEGQEQRRWGVGPELTAQRLEQGPTQGRPHGDGGHEFGPPVGSGGGGQSRGGRKSATNAPAVPAQL